MGLINARGGSKGIPKKNIQLIDGKPLIFYAIRAGKESKYIDRVVVSTENDEIAKIAKKYGAEVPFKRPKEFAEDDVSQYPPTKHAIFELKKQGWFPDVVVLLLTTAPFIRGEDVDKVIETLINSDVDSVRCVCEAAVPPYWMCTLEEDNSIKQFVKDMKAEDPDFCIRQNLPKVYEVAGMADTFWTKTVINTNSLFGNKVKAVVFEREKSIDIDTPFDLLTARTIMEHKSRRRKK